jgi:DNA-directed RNA polymerase specialized sigma54-like protein
VAERIRVRRPTVQDVAHEAGVSASTVSRALNATGYAARIGYVPDAWPPGWNRSCAPPATT